MGLFFNILLLSCFVFILGTCIGSFLNVVILRSLSGESIISPPSKCPKCNHKLSWWHNIPILSYILLKGKCAFCKEKISIQYPIIEFLTGCMFVLGFFKFGLTISTLFVWIIGSLFIVIATTDLKEKVVYDRHAYILIGTGLLYALLATILGLLRYYVFGQVRFTLELLLLNPLTLSLLGIITGILTIEILAKLSELLCSKRMFGTGDTYIMAGLGAIFGWETVLMIFLIAALLQVIFTIPIFVKKEIQLKHFDTLVSFATFLLYATVFCLLQVNGIITNFITYIVMTIILAALGIFVCIKVIKEVKNPTEQTILPFGPALIFAAFIFLLF